MAITGRSTFPHRIWSFWVAEELATIPAELLYRFESSFSLAGIAMPAADYLFDEIRPINRTNCHCRPDWLRSNNPKRSSHFLKLTRGVRHPKQWFWLAGAKTPSDPGKSYGLLPCRTPRRNSCRSPPLPWVRWCRLRRCAGSWIVDHYEIVKHRQVRR